MSDSQANDLSRGANATKPKPRRKGRAQSEAASEQNRLSGCTIIEDNLHDTQYSLRRLYARRAAYKVWLVFDINRYELDILQMFVAACFKGGKRTCSRTVLLETITGNSKAWAKYCGYFAGIVNRGMLEAIEMTAGHETYSLSPLGARVLEHFNNELRKLIKGDGERERRLKPHKQFAAYIDLEKMPVTVITELSPQAYKAFKNR